MNPAALFFVPQSEDNNWPPIMTHTLVWYALAGHPKQVVLNCRVFGSKRDWFTCVYHIACKLNCYTCVTCVYNTYVYQCNPLPKCYICICVFYVTLVYSLCIYECGIHDPLSLFIQNETWLWTGLRTCPIVYEIFFLQIQCIYIYISTTFQMSLDICIYA